MLEKLKKTEIGINFSDVFSFLGYSHIFEENFEQVTVGQAAQIVISTYNNVKNISDVVAYKSEDEFKSIYDYENDGKEKWKKYILENKVISEDEYETVLSYIRLYELLYECRKKWTPEFVEAENDIFNMDNNLYSQVQIKATQYLYENGIIDDDLINQEILLQPITKEDFEEIIVKYILKFNLMPFNKKDTLNYQETLNILKEIYHKDYFYIIAGVNEKELEYPYISSDLDNLVIPKYTYNRISHDFEKIQTLLSEYFDTILTIDYESFDKDGFKKKIKKLSNDTDFDLDSYTEFVLTNRLKINGNYTLILPIIYQLNEYYYCRVKVNLNTINTDVSKNLIVGFQDKKCKSEFYLDIPICYRKGEYKIADLKISQYIVKE